MRIVAALAAVLGWAALAGQLYLSLEAGAATGQATTETLLRYISFFTILTNILVALVLTQAARAPGRGVLGKPRIQAAAASYIIVVGLIYFAILRHEWAPTGLQWLVDVILHYAMPPIYLAFWLIFAPKGKGSGKGPGEGVSWTAPLRWLAYPAAYLAWILARGAVSGFYPYPFIDVRRLGYDGMALNALAVAGVFIAVGLAIVALARLAGSRLSARSQA
ncbi:Pr6Pr family membrane protein [Bosea lathyri]|uniref:FAR-17a/AIG1-like protein n=1 Tax=Bosea lathyri TaxID=1036778 RepID=A0A1H6AZ00_9HYPH|nr:Pr6Pr family membrane protein [Bosea lathyri]SEG53821.1 hypothetical protein SAMN04488115_106257 [Bosea lathyri]